MQQGYLLLIGECDEHDMMVGFESILINMKSISIESKILGYNFIEEHPKDSAALFSFCLVIFWLLFFLATWQIG